MKKICYFTIWREDSETVGINMKIKNQVKAFSNLGLMSYFCTSTSTHVKLYLYEDNQFKLLEQKELSSSAIYREDISPVKRKLSSTKRLKECLIFMNKVANEYGIDFIYIRRILPITIALKNAIVNWSKRNIKVIWEIPTWNTNDKRLYWRIINLQEKFMYKLLKNSIHQIVAIYSAHDKEDNILFINNGVDIETIPARVPIAHESINLICLATFSYWHGYDRLLAGLHDYYNNNKNNLYPVRVYMVGNGEIEELKELCKQYKIEEYVEFLGVKVGEELNELFNIMDIAIGNLGFFRQGVYSDTSIKIREYGARAIPFVTALEVNDYPEDYPYILKVSMDESPIKINEIIDFYNTVSSLDVNEMRQYAESALSWEKQLQKVVEKINN